MKLPFIYFILPIFICVAKMISFFTNSNDYEPIEKYRSKNPLFDPIVPIDLQLNIVFYTIIISLLSEINIELIALYYFFLTTRIVKLFSLIVFIASLFIIYIVGNDLYKSKKNIEKIKKLFKTSNISNHKIAEENLYLPARSKLESNLFFIINFLQIVLITLLILSTTNILKLDI